MKKKKIATVVLSLSLLAGTVWASGVPQAVSPGVEGGLARVADGCPTFSWSGVEGNQSFELVVYPLRKGAAGDQTMQPDLAVRLPGAALSWTPSLGDCLAPGGRYVWFVRSVGEAGVGEWSRGRGFEVAVLPTAVEVEAALEVLRRYVDSGGGGGAALDKDTVNTTAAPEEFAPASDALERTASALDGADFSIDASGNVAGASFEGDGSLLTGLDASNVDAGTVAIAHGGTGSTSATEALTSLGAASATDYSSHIGNVAAHHLPTVNCDGASCDGTSFTNLQWASLTGVPLGLDDGDDDTILTAGPGLVLSGTEIQLEPDAGPIGNRLFVLDPTTTSGEHSSAVLGADGYPVISYYYGDGGNDLKVAKCNDPACDPNVNGAESLVTVDSGGDVGQHPSIALGADGFPVISYFDATNGHLKVAKCNDPACDPAVNGPETLSTVDAATDVGLHSAIVVADDGYPFISYHDDLSGDLKVAKCNDPACDPGVNGPEAIRIADSESLSGTAAAIGADGFPTIAFWGAPLNAVNVLKCNDPACDPAVNGPESTSTVLQTNCFAGKLTSIAIDASGLPIVSFVQGCPAPIEVLSNAVVVKCNDPACDPAVNGPETLSGVASTFSPVTQPALALGADGLPVLSYHRAGVLTVTKCNDPACSGDDEFQVSVHGVAGAETSVVVGADGRPLVSYHDGGNLRSLKCGSAYCSAFAFESHEHDSRYYTRALLQTSGGSSVHWDNLTNLPGGFDDDVDNVDDTVSWGEISGLVGTGATQVSQGSHVHPDVWVDATGDSMTGKLTIVDSNLSGDVLSVVKGSGGAVTAAAVEVINTMSYGEGAWIRLSDASNTLPVAKLVIEGAATSDFLECEKGGTKVCQITAEGIVFTAPTDTPGTCNAAMEGARYYDASLKQLCFCNGTDWNEVDGGGKC